MKHKIRYSISTLFLIIMTTLISAQTSSNKYAIKILTDTDAQALIPFIAQTRITTFREYPYLYVGNLDIEIPYLKLLFKSRQSAVAVAYYGNEIVGFLTGDSFVEFDEHFQGSTELFSNNNLTPGHYYYFSEVIVFPEHRRKGIATKLFQSLEEYAFNLGYSKGCITVEDHIHHPLKPAAYKAFNWQKLGYTKTSMSLNFDWPTIQFDGTIKQDDHVLTYWIKNF